MTSMGNTHNPRPVPQSRSNLEYIPLVEKVRILENRLDKALTKFNEALAHNKTLRQEVNTKQVPVAVW